MLWVILRAVFPKGDKPLILVLKQPAAAESYSISVSLSICSLSSLFHLWETLAVLPLGEHRDPLGWWMTVANLRDFWREVSLLCETTTQVERLPFFLNIKYLMFVCHIIYKQTFLADCFFYFQERRAYELDKKVRVCVSVVLEEGREVGGWWWLSDVRKLSKDVS